MTSPETGADETPATLCSQDSVRRGLPLIGTAGCYQHILLFELESPWTPRLVGSRASDAALDAAIVRITTQAPTTRLLAVEPFAASVQGVRVLLFSRPPGAFWAYSRREFLVDRGHLADALIRLALEGEGAGEVASTDQVLRDVLVCTHGSRDACCGKFGYPLYREFAELASAALPAAAGAETPVRIWRSSHLGGHRFAPTLLDLPSGRMFGRLTDGDAAAVLGGGSPLHARLESIYRGRCALPEAAQIVERQLWFESGPDFADAELRWQVEGQGEAWRVEISAEAKPGRSRASFAMRAQVVRAEVEAVHTPASCGRDPEPEVPWRIIA